MKYTVLQIPFPRTKAEETIFCKYVYRPLRRIDYVHPEYYENVYNIKIKNLNWSKFFFSESIDKIETKADYNENAIENIFNKYKLEPHEILFFLCND